ncbi:unnamed protein product [Closterium sp. NIES-65]|nr:unnamed protein product [Closterium sp. NIES-65]
MQLGVRPRDTFNFDETALFISVLPRKTYGTGRSAGRKAPKERLTVGFLVNAEGSHAFRPLVISKQNGPTISGRTIIQRSYATGATPPKLFTHYIEQLDATMNAEDRNIVVLLDNASSHNLDYRRRRAHCHGEGGGTASIGSAPSRACGLPKAPPPRQARFKPNLRLVLEWLHDAWMNIPRSTIQRCWWRTGCLPHAWAMELPHVEPGVGGSPTAGGDIGLDDDVNDVGSLIDRLGLGPSAMPAQEFVAIDANQPTCAEPSEDPLAIEPRSEPTAEMWEAPASMQVVYDDSNPATREARRTARAACEMLIGYARATCITPRDMCALFDIRNPIIIAWMERASPALNLNASMPTAMSHEDNPTAETPRRRGRVLPAWVTVPTPDWVAQSARRQELIDAGAPAVMSGYLAAAEWMRL